MCWLFGVIFGFVVLRGVVLVCVLILLLICVRLSVWCIVFVFMYDDMVCCVRLLCFCWFVWLMWVVGCSVGGFVGWWMRC